MGIEKINSHTKGRIIDTAIMSICAFLFFANFKVWPFLENDTIMLFTFGACVALSFFVIIFEGDKERDYIQLFPTIGMFGTFIGVALALGGNPQDIDNLISGLSTAVNTTVCGMLFYLAWTFCFILKDILIKAPYRTPEENLENIANNIENISADLSEKLSENLETILLKINESIETNLGKELREFSNASAELLRWYESGMKVHTKSISEMQKIYEKMGEILEKITSTLDSTIAEVKISNEAIDQRNETLKEQNTLIDSWVTKMDGLRGSMTNTVSDLNSHLSAYQGLFREGLDSASQAVFENIDSLSGQHMKYFDQSLNKVVEAQYKLNEEMKSAMGSVFKEALADADKHIKQAFEVFSAQANNLSEEYRKDMKEAFSSTSELYTLEKNNASKELEAVSNQVSTLWGQHYNEINKILKKLQENQGAASKTPRVRSEKSLPSPSVSYVPSEVEAETNAEKNTFLPKIEEKAVPQKTEKKGFFSGISWPFKK